MVEKAWRRVGFVITDRTYARMGQHQMFENYIGIDYSGARTPIKRNSALQAFMSTGDGNPGKIKTDVGSNWNRKPKII